MKNKILQVVLLLIATIALIHANHLAHVEWIWTDGSQTTDGGNYPLNPSPGYSSSIYPRPRTHATGYGADSFFLFGGSDLNGGKQFRNKMQSIVLQIFGTNRKPKYTYYRLIYIYPCYLTAKMDRFIG